jgi:hypothetical protein
MKRKEGPSEKDDILNLTLIMSMLKKSECIKVPKRSMKALKENPIGNIFNVELFRLNHKFQKQAPHHKMTLPFMTSSN